MARDLDTLIDRAKALEPASPADRARVREALAERIASEPLPPDAAAVRRLPLVGASVLGIACAIGIGLAITSGTGSPAGSRLQAPGSRQQPETVAPAPAVAAPASQDQPQAPAVPPPQPLTVTRGKPEARSTKRPALLSLTEESRALGRVNQALRASSATAALALLDQQDREFAGGGLVAERAAARVLALCAAGRTSEAKLRADAFLREHAESPLRERVLGSCARSP